MYTVLLVIYSIISILLIGFILIQQGKGANLGASFGGGASGSIFGARGAGNFLSHSTAVLATGFFLISLILGNMNSNASHVEKGAFSDLSKVAEQVQSQSSSAVDTKANSITAEIPTESATPTKAPEVKATANETQTETKAVKTEAKEAKVETKSEVKLEAKASAKEKSDKASKTKTGNKSNSKEDSKKTENSK